MSPGPRLLDTEDVVLESVGITEFCLEGGSVDLELRAMADPADIMGILCSKQSL